jgi:HTH-type transcriptional regulator/antitoxin HigA
MMERTAAEVFPPGDLIREELEARGWTQNDLAEILGRPPRLVSEIISAKRAITPETAQGLADAFGTDAQIWMNLETSYQLNRLRKKDVDVSRRAKLYSFAPVKEMIRRHWVAPSDNVDVIEKQILTFFRVKSLDEPVEFSKYAARKTTYDPAPSNLEYAWLFRARQIARATPTSGPFTKAKLKILLEQLKALLFSAQEVRHVPRLLSQTGIRFVVVEPLPKTKIDGACLWQDDDPSKPIVALSIRYDRIDWFWHTLMHELDHVQHGDGLSGEVAVDIDLFREPSLEKQKPERERRANQFASASLIPKEELDDFVARIGPLYSKTAIKNFANRIRVHAGLVVGQLQFRGEIPYAHSREMLDKVREMLIESSLTDGWGRTVMLSH